MLHMSIQIELELILHRNLIIVLYFETWTENGPFLHFKLSDKQVRLSHDVVKP